MNELDLLTQFRSNVEEPSSDAWLRAKAAISAAGAGAADAAPAKRGLRLPGARLRGRSLAALLGTSGGVAAAVTAALVLTAGSAPSVAFAGWTADPTAPASGQVQAAESDCKRNSTLASLTPTLADTRGPYTLLLYADDSASESVCVTGPSLESPTGEPSVDLFGARRSASEAARRDAPSSGTAAPNATSVAPDAIENELKGAMITKASSPTTAFSYDVGRAGEGVIAVTLVLEDGSHIEATTANGCFAAWWPGGEGAQIAEITTTSGTTTQQLIPGGKL